MYVWLAETTLMALVLSGLAAGLSRYGRLNHSVRHALWMVVLVKLLTPPLFPISSVFPGLPAFRWPLPVAGTAGAPAATGLAVAPTEAKESLVGSRGEVAARGTGRPRTHRSPLAVEGGFRPSLMNLSTDLREQGAVAPSDPGVEPAPVTSELGAAAAEPTSWLDPAAILTLVFLVGGFVVLCRQAVRVVNVRRRLGRSEPAPDWLERQWRQLASDQKVRCPALRVVAGAGSPMLWCLGRPVLLVPSGLLGGLDRARWRGILLHELAHVRRGDAWVGRLLLVAEWLWWWNPVYWLVRGRLEREAELACDAAVVSATDPAGRRAYAESLIDVCALGSAGRGGEVVVGAVAVLGMGAGRSKAFLERRLTMIVRGESSTGLTGPWRWATAAAALLVLPAWSVGQDPTPPQEPPRQEAPPPPNPPEPPASPGDADDDAKAKQDLEREADELRRAAADLSRARADLRRRANELQRAARDRAGVNRQARRGRPEPSRKDAEQPGEAVQAAQEELQRALEHSQEAIRAALGASGDSVGDALRQAREELEKLKAEDLPRAGLEKLREAVRENPRFRVRIEDGKIELPAEAREEIRQRLEQSREVIRQKVEEAREQHKAEFERAREEFERASEAMKKARDEAARAMSAAQAEAAEAVQHSRAEAERALQRARQERQKEGQVDREGRPPVPPAPPQGRPGAPGRPPGPNRDQARGRMVRRLEDPRAERGGAPATGGLERRVENLEQRFDAILEELRQLRQDLKDGAQPRRGEEAGNDSRGSDPVEVAGLFDELAQSLEVELAEVASLEFELGEEAEAVDMLETEPEIDAVEAEIANDHADSAPGMEDDIVVDDAESADDPADLDAPESDTESADEPIETEVEA